MHGALSGHLSAEAISATDRSGENSDISVSDENWVSDMARALLAKPGLELHLITGIDERSCHRYASGDVKNPSAYFWRQLFRSEQGRPFLEFLMDGCEAKWWRDLKRAERIVAELDRIDMS